MNIIIFMIILGNNDSYDFYFFPFNIALYNSYVKTEELIGTFLSFIGMSGTQFVIPVRGRPFDSWGGLWFFCEKKDCSANFGK